MRPGTTLSLVAATAIVCSVSFVGCTSLLGDFEVTKANTNAETDSGGGGGDSGPQGCTQCGGQCVDLKSNSLNCGSCGLACQGGQTCGDSTCKCPMGQAFCSGACTMADRQHCGTTCKACAQDQICTDSCVVAPPPEFEKTPLTPTGWKDGAGAAIKFKIKSIGPNTTYECRTGPASSFTPTAPAWAPCDGTTGTGLDYTPTADSGTPEGSYRTELRYRNDTYISNAIGFDFYVINALNNVASCPRAGKDDGPHFTDDDYFAAAADYAMNGFEGYNFDITGQFPVPGSNPNLDLRNPTIKIPFSGIAKPPHMNADWAAFTGQVNLLSLRHHYTINGTHNLILVRRLYVHPTKNDCRNNVKVGTVYSEKLGPPMLGRGRRTLDCEALVLNSAGVALCMTPNPGKTKPVPMLIDECIDCTTGIPTSSFTWAANSTSVSQNPAAFNFNLALYDNDWIELPAKTGQWYQIKSHTDANHITVDRVINPTVGGTGPCRMGNNVSNPPKKRFVIPTGYAHLYEQKGHLKWPLGGTTTKCTTFGCATDPTKSLYLPP